MRIRLKLIVAAAILALPPAGCPAAGGGGGEDCRAVHTLIGPINFSFLAYQSTKSSQLDREQATNTSETLSYDWPIPEHVDGSWSYVISGFPGQSGDDFATAIFGKSPGTHEATESEKIARASSSQTLGVSPDTECGKEGLLPEMIDTYTKGRIDTCKRVTTERHEKHSFWVEVPSGNVFSHVPCDPEVGGDPENPECCDGEYNPWHVTAAREGFREYSTKSCGTIYVVDDCPECLPGSPGHDIQMKEETATTCTYEKEYLATLPDSCPGFQCNPNVVIDKERKDLLACFKACPKQTR